MTRDCFIVWIAIVFCFCTNQALAAEKTIGVFVALADNASQGIVPVPAAIGNGDDPGRNLYWGTAEGFHQYISRKQRVIRSNTPCKK